MSLLCPTVGQRPLHSFSTPCFDVLKSYERTHAAQRPNKSTRVPLEINKKYIGSNAILFVPKTSFFHMCESYITEK